MRQAALLLETMLETRRATCCCSPAHQRPSHRLDQDKPDLSNIELISQALRSDHCAKRAANSRCRRCTSGSPTDGSGSSATVGTPAETGGSSLGHASVPSRVPRAIRRSTASPVKAASPPRGSSWRRAPAPALPSRRRRRPRRRRAATRYAANAGPAGSACCRVAPRSPVPIRRRRLKEQPLLPQPLLGLLEAQLRARCRRSGSLLSSRNAPSSATAAAADKPKAAPGTIWGSLYRRRRRLCTTAENT